MADMSFGKNHSFPIGLKPKCLAKGARLSDSTDQITVPVPLGSRSYEIEIVTDQFDRLPPLLADWIGRRNLDTNTALIITDTHLEKSHAETVRQALEQSGWKIAVHVLEPGEKSKTLAVAEKMYDTLIGLQADRHTVVIAVGGGVVGDAAGFVAATYARGIPFVQVPTSLLAHVDSSVGGKVAVNHPQGKNLIGAFYQPLGVFVDTAVLNTLPERDFRSGLAEVVKYGVILDAEFFKYLEDHILEINSRSPAVLRNIIARCCELKAHVVEQDEQETTGIRAALNYGHTFAHAFEALCGYGELMHGEAVAIGMIYASRLAERLKLIEPVETERQITLLESLGLPTTLPEGTELSVDDILGRMQLDKKTLAGQLRFVLPTKMGRVEVFKDIEEATVRELLKSLL